MKKSRKIKGKNRAALEQLAEKFKAALANQKEGEELEIELTEQEAEEALAALQDEMSRDG